MEEQLEVENQVQTNIQSVHKLVISSAFPSQSVVNVYEALSQMHAKRGDARGNKAPNA